MEELTRHQKHLIAEFKTVISDTIHPNHDELELLKWLKARNFDLKKAEKMYRKSMAWREEVGADTILETYVFSDILKHYLPGGLSGYDKEGRPVWIDPLGRADMKGIMLSVKKSEIMRAMIYRMEKLCAELRRCSQLTGKRIYQCIQILDMDGFGSKMMWKPVLDFFIELLQILENNYPETLKRTYIINAPRIFHIGWKVMKAFINEDTASKFKFLEKDYSKILLQVIAPDQLPVYYGGMKRDPDGNPKCENLICYGGDVPKELYKNKNDVFPPGIVPKEYVLGRSGTFTVGFSIPDTSHVIEYLFSVDWGTLDYAVYRDIDGGHSPGGATHVNRIISDVSKMDVVQPMRTIDCSRIPEDGLIFFEHPAYYCVHFRNTSRIYRKTLTYVMDVKVIDDNAIRDSAVTIETADGELTQL